MKYTGKNDRVDDRKWDMSVAWSYAMLESPNEDETAVLGCHCPGEMAVRMWKVLAKPQSW